MGTLLEPTSYGPSAAWPSTPWAVVLMKTVTKSDTVTDFVTVFIKTTAQGVLGQAAEGPYDVGSRSVPITLVRNLKPHFRLLSPPVVSNRLGCPDPKVRFNYVAWDDDGSCELLFLPADGNTAMGGFQGRTGYRCSRGESEPLEFKLLLKE